MQIVHNSIVQNVGKNNSWFKKRPGYVGCHCCVSYCLWIKSYADCTQLYCAKCWEKQRLRYKPDYTSQCNSYCNKTPSSWNVHLWTLSMVIKNYIFFSCPLWALVPITVHKHAITNAMTVFTCLLMSTVLLPVTNNSSVHCVCTLIPKLASHR